jgi:flagellar basal body-associated protein FliL
VTYGTYDDSDYEPKQEPKRGRLFSIAIIITLVLVGVASAFFWHAYGDDLAALPSLASANGLSNASAGQPASTAKKSVGLQEFQAFQLQLAGQT